jgi:hypothetical protein
MISRRTRLIAASVEFAAEDLPALTIVPVTVMIIK